jgi:elongation factor 1 alpha-like protein
VIHIGLLPIMDSAPCCAKYSAAEFFKDSPWLRIPEDRRGEILVEPLYPRGGLLGGSSSASGPKVSKLAALAAARKKKESNDRSGDSTQNLTTSVALLDKLGGKTNASKVGKESKLKCKTPSSETTPSVQREKSEDRKYPVRRRKSSSPPAHAQENVSDLQGSGNIPTKSESPTAPVTVPSASPSTFAQTIIGSSKETQKTSINILESSSFFVPLEFASNTKSDPFAGPSPDDVVIKAQNSKGSIQKDWRSLI